MTHDLDPGRLLRRELAGPEPPWSSGDKDAVEAFIHKAVEAIEAETNTSSRAVFDDYGSGYASYVDAWFYRPTEDFRTGPDQYVGLVVLFSRLTNHFVVGEGAKHWNDSGSASSYLPAIQIVDAIENEAVSTLASTAIRILTGMGVRRLKRDDLNPLLPEDTDVPTILTEGPFRLFDAVFYWED